MRPDIYISDTLYLKILPLTRAGETPYHELIKACTKMGISIHDLTIHARPGLVNRIENAGYRVTSKLPKTDFDNLTDDELMKELELEA